MEREKGTVSMDEKDRDIILSLLDGDKTIHQLSRTLFKTEDQWELRKHNSFLRYRLGRLEQDGLVRRQGKSFHVPREDMTIGKARLIIDNGRERIELEMGKILVTEKKDGDRQILLLE